MKKKCSKGFSLVELVVAMGIMATLMLIAALSVIAARNAAKETANVTNAQNVEVALKAYYSKYRTYPTLNGDFNAAEATLADLLNLTDASSCLNKGGTVQSGNATFDPDGAGPLGNVKYYILPVGANCTTTLPNRAIYGK